MKTLVLYYSYTGNTKRIAEELAAKEEADITEIVAASRPGKFKAYVVGSFAAMRGKAWLTAPLGVDLSVYDRMFLLAPIWAGFPAPYMYSVLKQLPAGKAVSFMMISGSGTSGCRERLEAMVLERGCTLEGYKDIKA